MVIAEDLFEVDGPDLFADRNNHEAKCWREWTAHGTASTLMDALLAQSKCLHIQCRFDEVRNIFDDDLAGDIESTEGSTFDAPGLLVLPGYTENASLLETSMWGRRKSKRIDLDQSW